VRGARERRMDQSMKSGKLPINLLKKVLTKYTLLDPSVIVGPKIGEDAAVVDLGKEIDRYWVVTSDPITFTTEEIGYYGVVVNINDIATRGATPKWFLATLLFPEEGSDQKLILKTFRQIHDACRRFNVSFVGGHTEITPGLDRIILSGHMIGEVKKENLVKTSGARAGDLLLMVKGVCIEGTSIIAREKGKELLAKGFHPSFIKRAKSFIFNPGIDVLKATQIACRHALIHSMHDPTEGGLINGIIEMAIASEKEFEVDLEKVFIYEESRILCGEFGINPLGTIASGSLLMTLSPKDLPALQKAFQKVSIPIQVIGRVKRGPARALTIEGKRKKQLKPLIRDEILKIYSTGKMELCLPTGRQGMVE
ncbi:MAG: AIR synthase family protein, partial [Thermodesulfobacteriota bacterium]|nr:AIR synthase family protein [Thermodesulfobacteriota bacterium]